MVSRAKGTLGVLCVLRVYRRESTKTKLGAGPIAGSVNLPPRFCDQ